MVETVVGKINGLDIILSPVNEEQTIWSVDIPTVPSGVYIVEFTATDQAGNESYFAKYIVTIDIDALTAKIEPFNYSEEVEPGIIAVVEGEAYECEI